MDRRLPAQSVELIRSLIAVGRYIDHLADVAISDRAHATARAHANAVWRAAERLDDLAAIVEDLTSAPVRRPGDRDPGPPVQGDARGAWMPGREG